MTTLPRATDDGFAARICERVAEGTLSLPPLPDVALQLLELLRDEDAVDSARVAELIRSDTAVAASVLRVANSAAFGGLRAVGDVQVAIARLGLKQVSAIVTTLATRAHYRTEHPAREGLLMDLWDTALTSAIAARQIALVKGGDRIESYVAGLLHDVGALLVIRAAEEFERTSPGTEVSDAVLVELMELLHTDIGYCVLKNWHIPDPICEAAHRHHEALPEPCDPLLLRIQAADAIADRVCGRGDPRTLAEVAAVDRLQFTELDLASLVVDIEDEFARVKSLF